jgi:hypothetical protein
MHVHEVKQCDESNELLLSWPSSPYRCGDGDDRDDH